MSSIPPHVNHELIRRYADGELDAAELAQLQNDVPAEVLERAANFEHALRRSVGLVMSTSTPAPAALRERVAAAMAAESALADEPVGRVEPARSTEPQVETTSAGRFSRTNILAVAASLVLIAGAVLFGIYGKPIDQWSQNNTAATAGEVSEFVSSEHDRCAFSDKVRQEKIKITEQKACNSKVSRMLGLQNKQVTMFDLNEPDLGYAFLGAGECHVPNYERSAHLMYKRVRTGTTPAMASIFVCSRGSTSAELAPGEWMELPYTAGCTHAVFSSTDGSVDYLLVCCDAEDIKLLRASIGRQLRRSCGLASPTK